VIVLAALLLTLAPVKPAPLPGSLMIAMAWVMRAGRRGFMPLLRHALRVTAVRWTGPGPAAWKLLCHLAGWTMFPRRTPASITI